MEITKSYKFTDTCSMNLVIDETVSDDGETPILSLETKDEYFYFDSENDVNEFCDLLKKIAKDYLL